jgi:hypothetical protein
MYAVWGELPVRVDMRVDMSILLVICISLSRRDAFRVLIVLALEGLTSYRS